MVIKKRNIELEARFTKNQATIVQLTKEKKDLQDDFKGYKDQTKDEKTIQDTTIEELRK